MNDFHDDLKLVLLRVREDLPLLLFGHSMGCLVIGTFLINNPDLKITGVVLNSGMVDKPKTLSNK